MISADTLENLQRQLDVLPERLAGHVALSLGSLAVGIAISIPLGVWATRRPHVRKLALTVASVVQTVPSIALLAATVLVLGRIGWVPAMIALVLYSILPVLRNTITGIQQIDPNYLEAARGVGMTDGQMLRRVELPLAAPTILAGVRTASVWVVGAATLAQPVGATSLGNYVFAGLQTRNGLALGIGCALSAALALVIDGLLQLVETSAARRKPRLALWAGVGIAVLAFSPLALGLLRSDARGFDRGEFASDEPAADTRPYVVAAKAFSEQYILAGAMQHALQEAGYATVKKEGMGSTLLLDALTGGEIDCYVDYTGTIWATAMKRDETVSPAETLVAATAYLWRERGIVCLGPLGFNNTYAIAIRRPRAESLGLNSLVDLAPHAAEMSIGSDVEFFDRAEFFNLQQRYGLRFAAQRALDSTLMYAAAARGDIDLIAGYSTDGRIDRFDLQVLDDPRQAFPPYDAILLVSPRLARDTRAAGALGKLVGKIDDARMRRANGMVDVDQKSPAAAAEWLVSGVVSR